MPTSKMSYYSFKHKFFWEKHKDLVLSKLEPFPDGASYLQLSVHCVYPDELNKDWPHRCQRCECCVDEDGVYCHNCAFLQVAHEVGAVYFLVDYFEKKAQRLVFHFSRSQL